LPRAMEGMLALAIANEHAMCMSLLVDTPGDAQGSNHNGHKAEGFALHHVHNVRGVQFKTVLSLQATRGMLSKSLSAHRSSAHLFDIISIHLIYKHGRLQIVITMVHDKETAQGSL